MDIFLSKLTQQAMTYAIRSGISITSGFAIQQCSRLLKTVRTKEHDELRDLQRKLDSKIKIIAPAIDMIELIAARGNTSLESAVALTKSIRWDIQQLGARIARAVADEESLQRTAARPKSRDAAETELRLIIKDIKDLLGRIEDAVPLINLAITTSGASLSTNLPASISPSRLLQASTFLSAGDAQYAINSSGPVQIGPRFTLSMYMLFQGHVHKALDEDGFRATIWKEVIHKAQVKLMRVPLRSLDRFPFQDASSHDKGEEFDPTSDTPQQVPADIPSHEFAYQLSIIEDLDDDRVHTFEDDQPQPGPLDDVPEAGMRTFVPVHQISKIFYADTGKILNIGTDGESNNPIILLKRDTSATPPRRMMEVNDLMWDGEMSEFGDGETATGEGNAHEGGSASVTAEAATSDPWALPTGLDLEWIALEVFSDSVDSDDDLESTNSHLGDTPASRPSSTSYVESIDATFATAMSRLNLTSSNPPTPQSDRKKLAASSSFLRGLPTHHAVTSSLSLLEMLVRLTSLQQFQQASHLTISDELLNFFLEESSTTGAAPGDAEARKRVRWEARQHVGFDPYDESPIKRRGEAYQRHARGDSEAPRSARTDTETPESPSSPLRHKTSRRQQESTPPLPGDRSQKSFSPVHSPGSSLSRAEFLREEGSKAKHNAPGKSSPLARAL